MGAVFGRISVEVPKHETVYTSEKYEVRRYPSSVAAVVYAKDVTDPRTNEIPTQDRFNNVAFGMLARYIGVFSTPENKSSKESSEEEKISMTAPVVMEPPSEKISMTAPVVVEPPSEKVSMTAPVVVNPSTEQNESDSKSSSIGSSMKFLLPDKYQTIEDAPKPTNPAIKIEMVEGGRCEAVSTFSGNFDMNGSTEKANELLAILKEDNVKVIGDWNLQGYNPPFTLPMFKRNEIHVPIDPTCYPKEEPAQEQASS